MDSEKSWSRLRRETISGVLLSLLIAPGAAGAQIAGRDEASASQAGASSPLDHFIATVATMRADFVQETWSVDQELVETATGRFSLMRPARFVWHYDSPFEQLVVADGKTLWMYDVELEQVTRTPLDDLAAANPALLLSGERMIGDEFALERSYGVDDLEFLELVPRDPLADFSRVLVGFRGDTPVRIEIVDGLNQTTRIEFSDVELNPEVDPSVFEFEPPPNADVIGNE